MGHRERASNRIARLSHSLRDTSNQGLMTSCCLTFIEIIPTHPHWNFCLKKNWFMYVWILLYTIFSAIVLISCIFCLRKIILKFYNKAELSQNLKKTYLHRQILQQHKFKLPGICAIEKKVVYSMRLLDDRHLWK